APTVTITGLASGTLQSGGETSLSFKVRNNNPDPTPVNVQVGFTGQIQGLISCDGSCDFTDTIDGNAEKTYNATLRAGTAPPGQTRQGQLRIVATANGESSQPATRPLTVVGPQQQAPTVPEVSGQVENATDNSPIPNAKVTIQDSAGKTWEVGTDGNGNFRITSEAEKPITPGVLSFLAQKDGFNSGSPTTATATANQPLTGVRIAILPLASASAEPSASAEASISPSVSDIASAPAEEPAGSGGSGLSWVLIVLGALLVLLGIGAIVMLFIKRKGEEDGDDPDRPRGRRPGPPGAGPGRGGPRPPMRRGGPPPDRTAVMRGGPGGPHDPHRPMRPVSPGPRGADQTMIARSPLADAPTQIHRPAGHDPYGPPPGSPAGGPGQGGPYAPGGYPGGQASAYPGGAPAYGQPDPYAPGYGGATGPDPYGRTAPTQPTYGQPYGQGQPDPYAPNPDPRSPRPPQDPRRVDWLDD
ncbi:MAG TPA: carboxypeptidase regulatory-like domain-containing protein, partial [Micromonosporaceae bacterium]|nr:carboxypeptidase regulatory-like domain-containing protein [Micromonosporaceae bacterium]